MEKFKAVVKYNDYTGSVAADDKDSKPFRDLLKNNSNRNNFVTGVKVKLFPVGNSNMQMVTVYFYTKDGCVKEKEISIVEFLSYFKRFSMTLSFKGGLEEI